VSEDESDIDFLNREIKDLRRQVNEQGMQLKILSIVLFVTILTTYLIGAGELGFIILVLIFVFPIAICFNSLEKRGI